MLLQAGRMQLAECPETESWLEERRIVDMEGMLAKSKAGHDKDSIYVILREEGEYVYLVDGKTRSIARPKKKNRKHVQIIKKNAVENSGRTWEDAEIRRTLKAFEKSLRGNENLI